MSIIGKKLGNAKKHNGQILEHNRLRPQGVSIKYFTALVLLKKRTYRIAQKIGGGKLCQI